MEVVREIIIFALSFKEFVYENRAAVIAECEIVWQ